MEDKSVEKIVNDYQTGQISRRGFLRMTVALVGATAAEALLVSCQAAPTQAPVGQSEETSSESTSSELQPSSPKQTEHPEEAKGLEWVDCTKYKKDPPWTIANPTQGPTNSWALMLDAHTEYAVFEKYKDYFSDYYYADSGGNAAKQVSDMESVLVKKPDIIIGGALGAAGKAIYDRAFDSGIPLVIGQLPYQSDKYVSFVNPDNYLNGAKCAEWVAKKINGKGKIVMTSGIAGTDTAESRLQGAKDVFANYPDIEVLAHGYMDWSISKAKQGFEAWLASYPQIDAIWSDSAFMAWGAIEAFVEAKRDIPPMTAEPLNGFLKLVKQHGVEFFARGYPNAFGLDEVDMAVRVMMGEVVPKYQFIPSIEFENDKLDQYLFPDMSDDLWVDYRFPRNYIDKLFNK
jgi:ribose transport system substrate-binding protein